MSARESQNDWVALARSSLRESRQLAYLATVAFRYTLRARDSGPHLEKALRLLGRAVAIAQARRAVSAAEVNNLVHAAGNAGATHLDSIPAMLGLVEPLAARFPDIDEASNEVERDVVVSLLKRMGPTYDAASRFLRKQRRTDASRRPVGARWVALFGAAGIAAVVAASALIVCQKEDRPTPSPAESQGTQADTGSDTDPDTLSAASVAAPSAPLGFKIVRLVVPKKVDHGANLPLQITLQNVGTKTWTPKEHPGSDASPVRMAIRNWVRLPDGYVPLFPDSTLALHTRAPLPGDVPPQGTVELKTDIQAPYSSGDYKALLNLVDHDDQVFPQPDILLSVIVR